MNDLALLDTHGPDATTPDPHALAAARARLVAETGRREVVHSRFSRRTVLAGIAAAAAAVVVLSTAVPGGPAAPGPTAPSTAVSLVAFTNPTFPLTLTVVPEGLAAPRYDVDPGRGTVGFRLPNVDEPLGGGTESFDDVRVDVTATEPPPHELGTLGPLPDVEIRSVDVGGVEATVTELRYPADELNPTRVDSTLVYARRPDQWIVVSGMGKFSADAVLIEIASALVDEPVAVLPVELSVAPAGWVLAEIRDSRLFFLRVPGTDRTMVVRWLAAFDPSFQDPAMLDLGGPVDSITEVQVNGERGFLVDSPAGWLVEANLADGSAFTLQLPRDLSVEQVTTIAAGITRR